MIDRIASRLEMRREIALARRPSRSRTRDRDAADARRARRRRSVALARRARRALRARAARHAPRASTPMRAACARAGHPGARVRGRPRRGHQRQGLDVRDGRVDRARARACGRGSTRRRTSAASPSASASTASRSTTTRSPTCLERALAIGADLSFFETATLAAFLAFRDAKVDLAVIEVGIGGRLDATNVRRRRRASRRSRASRSITRTRSATRSTRSRARRPGSRSAGVDIVLGPMQRRRPRRHRRGRARRGRHDVAPPSDDADARAIRNSAHVGLDGAHQHDNARIAYVLGSRIGATPSGVRARHRAREVARAPRAHRHVRPATSSSTPRTTPTARARSRATSRDRAIRADAALVFGALADKAWPEMLDVLAPRAAHRVYVAPKGRAATKPSAIAARQPRHGRRRHGS